MTMKGFDCRFINSLSMSEWVVLVKIKAWPLDLTSPCSSCLNLPKWPKYVDIWHNCNNRADG